MSQKAQRRLQPARRTKIVGSPCRSPSPWTDGKTSTIFRVGRGSILGFPDGHGPDREVLLSSR